VKVRLGLALLLLLMACGQTERPKAPVPPAPSPNPSVGEWTWHPIGGVAVVEGELTEPTELILEGASIRERRHAELGPVRWEFFRPPPGEGAVLRTADGRVLARFTFALQAPPPPPGPASRLARRSEAPASSAPASPSTVKPVPVVPPVPEAPAPQALAEARLRALPVPPIPARKAAALPSVSRAPAVVSSAAAANPYRLEPMPLPAAKPATPPPLTAALPLPPISAIASAAASPATSWPGGGEALNLTRGPGGHKRLLLSFDGGSSAEVATEVLDLLKTRGVHTTLFLTGAFIQRFPALVKRMAAEGHELGNHTMNHPHFAPGMKRDPKWTKLLIQRELLDADAALVRLLGRPMDPFWRAPYGEHTAEIRRWAEELGYRHVGWSEGADTLDWATPKERRLYRSGEAIVSRLQQRLSRDGDGLIVLMHLGSGREEGDRPTDGLGAFMDRAKKEGWTFVSAGGFLRDLGKPAWDPQARIALLNGKALQAR
jgi:peptidoglycan/xylan/chitin deacetylase (PgdA/CDA1 family)